MTDLFLKVLNMSIAASWLVLAVMVLRILFRRAPKWVSVLLWGIVAVRLLCPFSIESALSLIPSAKTVPIHMEVGTVPAIDSGIHAINEMINPILSQAYPSTGTDSADSLQGVLSTVTCLWVLGLDAMLLYTAISYLRLRRKVSTAVILRDNIFQSEYVTSPFVLGILRPKIYLPYEMDPQDLEHVVAHEQAHIRRRDHWWKPLGFLLLTIHWFNPLMWVAYILLCRDIELACDEKVIRELGSEQRADYTQALVACSISRRRVSACPLAFGEVGVKERVKSVMHYKKPAFWVILLAVVTCVIVAVCFLTDPKRDSFDIKIVVPAGSQESFVYSHEEISPVKNTIILSSGENLGDTEVVLKPVEGKRENAYEPTYLTPGMPVKMEAEKGAWFQIGVNVQNPTEEDMVVYVSVDNVEVRIASRQESAGDESSFNEMDQFISGQTTPRVEEETKSNTLRVRDYTVQEIGRGELKDAMELAKEDLQTLMQILEGIRQQYEGTTDCASDCAINLNGRLLYYHSECGTFNEPDLSAMSTISSQTLENTGRNYRLTDAQKAEVNAILEKYIRLQQEIPIP